MAFAVLLVGAALAEPLDLKLWSHRAAVQLAAPASAKLAELLLPPEVLDLAAESLADLRLVDEPTGAETPYDLLKSERAGTPKAVTGKVYNRTGSRGGDQAVTVDLGEPLFKDEIEIMAVGHNYRRRAAVDASDDAADWQPLVEEAWVFAAPGPPVYRANGVALPVNDFRYLRVTVFGPADDDFRWKGDVYVQPAEAPAATPIRFAPAQTVSAEVENDTVITLDAGAQHLRISGVRLRFQETMFQREARVFSRPGDKRTVKIRREDGSEIERTEDVPWSSCGGSVIRRYETHEQTLIRFPVVNDRYLQIRIANGNDRPLTLPDAELRRVPVKLRFLADPPRRLTLYFGNPEAQRPSYDLAQFANRLAAEGVAVASLRAVEPNPVAKPSEKVSTGEEYARWLAVPLVAAVLVMLWLVRRQMRKGADNG
jgi:hypothetical protein